MGKGLKTIYDKFVVKRVFCIIFADTNRLIFNNMANTITFSFGELTISDLDITFKTLKPFSLSTISRTDFAGINILEERILKRSDWAYAFRFAGIGLLLFFVWNGIGYGVNGLQGRLGKFFLYSSIIFLPLVTLGSAIIFFSFWDALFGSTITSRGLLKFFGKPVTIVVIASKSSQHIKFYLINETDKKKIDDLLKVSNTL